MWCLNNPTPVPAEPLPVITPIYEDEHLLVLDKPSGLLSVPGRGPDKQDCLSKRVQDRYPDALVVHRLDQDTSGLLIMARGIEAQRRISRAFETRQVHKRYVALVAGNPLLTASAPNDEGWYTVEGPILLDWERRPIHIIHPDGKPSRSLWRSLHVGDTASLIELEPFTGRTHQLRVHMQSLGHPMLGDSLYAPPEVLAMSPRLMLHAKSLALAHPFTQEPLAFELPMAWAASAPYQMA
ncbi:RluA family pseudouridine synthase [Limnohabitans sp. JirII-31]|uniref:RluA family pseudouridine synthase n=1 Tax=Limnohabitans sp. JirII-31 TaxID=1977908 RepID=UPI000C1E8DA1|nr:RluA family pseudouridine synthase [Limnohabitans sp. JirII-31]PIT73818.1 RNA pseudouridine synthase [Limnohabitans sp. JirII-31]